VTEQETQVPGVVSEALQHEAQLQQGEPVPTSASFTELSAALQRETGLRAWLRSRSTTTRYALLGGAMLITLLVVLKYSVRPDFSDATERVLSALLIYGCAGGGALALALRPLHRAGWPGKAARIILAAGIGGALGLALFPLLIGEPLSNPVGPLAAGAADCFVWGSALSAPLLVLGWLLGRGGDNVAARLLLTGGAAGLAGNLYLECHCPIQSPDHMMLGHVTVVLAMLLAGLLLTLLPESRKSVE